MKEKNRKLLIFQDFLNISSFIDIISFIDMMISEKKKYELFENTEESCFHFCFVSGPARGQKILSSQEKLDK